MDPETGEESFLAIEIETMNEVRKWAPLMEMLAVVVLVCGIVGLFLSFIK